VRPLDIEFDKVVQWIANPLLVRHPAESPQEQQYFYHRTKQERNKFPFENQSAGG